MTDFYNLVPMASERQFDNIARSYIHEDVMRLRGLAVIKYSPAKIGTNRLWDLVNNEEFVNASETDEYTAIKYQRKVGTGCFDAVSMAITAGRSSTSAMNESTEPAQFTAAE